MFISCLGYGARTDGQNTLCLGETMDLIPRPVTHTHTHIHTHTYNLTSWTVGSICICLCMNVYTCVRDIALLLPLPVKQTFLPLPAFPSSSPLFSFFHLPLRCLDSLPASSCCQLICFYPRNSSLLFSGSSIESS